MPVPLQVLPTCMGAGPLVVAPCKEHTRAHVQGKAGWAMYRLFEKQRDQGDFSILPELHSVLSGMKVGHAAAALLQGGSRHIRPGQPAL